MPCCDWHLVGLPQQEKMLLRWWSQVTGLPSVLLSRALPTCTPPPQGCLLTRPSSKLSLRRRAGNSLSCEGLGLGGLPLPEWVCLAPLLALWDQTLFFVRGLLNF